MDIHIYENILSEINLTLITTYMLFFQMNYLKYAWVFFSRYLRSKIGFGSILNLHDFERRFKSPMRKEPVSEAQYLLEDNEDIDALTGLKECLDLTKTLSDIKDEMSKNDIVSFYVPADSLLARRVLHLRNRLMGHLHHLQHKIMRQ